MLYPNQYEILKRHGNTVISEEKYEKYGEKAIIKHIKKKLNLDVEIIIIDSSINKPPTNFQWNQTPSKTILIQKKR